MPLKDGARHFALYSGLPPSQNVFGASSSNGHIETMALPAIPSMIWGVEEKAGSAMG